MDLLSYMIGKKSGGSGDEPSGSITITENGTHNVKKYATAIVRVSSEELPSADGEEF